MTVDKLDRIAQLRGPLYQRVLANCCTEHGLGSDRELQRHAAAICLLISERSQALSHELLNRAREAVC